MARPPCDFWNFGWTNWCNALDGAHCFQVKSSRCTQQVFFERTGFSQWAWNFKSRLSHYRQSSRIICSVNLKRKGEDPMLGSITRWDVHQSKTSMDDFKWMKLWTLKLCPIEFPNLVCEKRSALHSEPCQTNETQWCHLCILVFVVKFVAQRRRNPTIARREICIYIYICISPLWLIYMFVHVST